MPVTRPARVSLLTDDERHELLETWNATTHPAPMAVWTSLFEAQARRAPDAAALVMRDETVSYSTLDARATALAAALLTRGAGPEQCVALAVPRSLETLIALLAIAKSGAAYLPVDVEQPRQRIETIVDQARPVCAVTTTTAGARLPEALPRVSIDSADVREAMTNHQASSDAPASNPGLFPEQPAYVLFTSGSSGVPKGVVVTHVGLGSLVGTQTERCAISNRSRVLHCSSLGFDASVWEIVTALTTGAALIVVDEESRSGDALAEALVRHAATHALIPPAILGTCAPDPAMALETLVVGGDACSRELVEQWSAGRRLVNAYGPTESTVAATMSGPLAGDGVPIGRPVWNTRVYVLDQRLEPVPPGIDGELYIAGAGLARGYLGEPGQSAERFVADPYGRPGSRMYRSGDLARWRRDGQLDFVGRSDGQIKIRGQRVELGEIESALRRDARVKDAIVTVHGEGDDKRLLAYVLSQPIPVAHDAARTAQIDSWQQLYDSTYESRGEADEDARLVGWMSSYTGDRLPAREMRAWVDGAVERIRALLPARVLEIGCGTGLLLTRLAGECARYIGTDFSKTVLDRLAREIQDRPELRHVELREALATELGFLEDGAVDLVILNSVVQYFPDVDYLSDVLRAAVRVVRPGGHIFVGDVRSLPLQDAFHASVQLFQAADDATVDTVRLRMRQALAAEPELVVDPRYFLEIARRWPGIGRVKAAPKPGTYDNELSRFRYDVTIAVGSKQARLAPSQWLQWDAAGEWRRSLDAVLARDPRASIGVRGVSDRRTAPAMAAARQLRRRSGAPAVRDIEALRAAVSAEPGEDLDAIVADAGARGVTVEWDLCDGSGTGTLIYNAFWQADPGEPELPVSQARAYANAPARHTSDLELARTLQESLRQTLPAYMVPMSVRVLDVWPLTTSGKVDRRALPVPDTTASATNAAPHTPVEELLCDLFADVLNLERVGVDDDFFMLGGHSLLATRVMSRVRTLLDVDPPLRALFEAPTVRDLALTLREAVPGRPPLRAEPRPAQLPMSYAQQRLWFLHQIKGQRTAYNAPSALRVRGRLDVSVLAGALSAIVERHEALRTRFEVQDQRPVQVIDPARPVDLPIEDLRTLSPESQQARIVAALGEEADLPFDLARGPLVRARLLRLAQDEHVLLRTLHHISTDAWSEGIFNRELLVLYDAHRTAGSGLSRLPVQYADYALWQRRWLEGDTLDRGLVYWREQLADLPEGVELPADRPRPRAETFEGDVCHMTLTAAQLTALKHVGLQQRATLYMTLTAALGLLLSGYTGSKDIVIGASVANRQDPLLEGVIGCFVNTLALRIRPAPGATLRTLLGDVRRTMLDAYRYEDLPFERIVESLGRGRGRRAAPFFPVVFALGNMPWQAPQLAGLSIEPLYGETMRVRTDLEIHAWERDRQLEMRWLYNREMFDRWRITQMMAHYGQLLEDTIATGAADGKALTAAARS